MNALQRESKEERRLRRARSREAAGFKSPVVRRREEKLVRTTGFLPGLDIVTPSKPEPVRSDELWRNAEDIICFVLRRGGYHVVEQVKWGRSHGGNKVVDFICWLPWEPQTRIAIEVKWSRTKGSWDKKIPDEAETLFRCIGSDDVKRAYVVVFGPGIDKMREKGWLSGRLDHGRTVRVVDVDFFACAAGTWEL